MADNRLETFTAHYLAFFGERTYMFIDLFPESAQGEHVDLSQKTYGLPPAKALEEMDKYTHPCWCHPELIYADDKRGNEVWLHKRAQ